MKKNLLLLCLVASSCLTLTNCNKKSHTAEDVKKASEMTLEELEAASKAEMEASDDTFKVLGLTSVLAKVATKFAEKYDWISYGNEDSTKDNMYVNNSYKDYQLLEALKTAENSYVADYALIQDVRYFSTFIKDGITHNFVPSDWEALGLKEEDTLPLKGVHFNKLFWTNTNFTNVTGKTLYNIWQLAGTSADPDHLSKVSFQTPETEQINMSFLVSCEAPENQKRIEDAYKSYYKKDWVSDGTYENCGTQWVNEFMKNISRWHKSDGTAMKETQLKDDWNEGYVYYGAFAKMKDAVSKYYAVEGLEDMYVEYQEKDSETGQTVTKRGVNAMSTVKWDWEIEGFNGFMYCMDSQVINYAKHPYTACLYARFLLDESSYSSAIYNSSTPGADGKKANQYGYYYPGKASENFKYAKGDWTKEKHIEKEINENYQYLKDVKASQVDAILALMK